MQPLGFQLYVAPFTITTTYPSAKNPKNEPKLLLNVCIRHFSLGASSVKGRDLKITIQKPWKLSNPWKICSLSNTASQQIHWLCAEAVASPVLGVSDKKGPCFWGTHMRCPLPKVNRSPARRAPAGSSSEFLWCLAPSGSVVVSLQLHFFNVCFSANDLLSFIIKYKSMEELLIQSFLSFVKEEGGDCQLLLNDDLCLHWSDVVNLPPFQS